MGGTPRQLLSANLDFSTLQTAGDAGAAQPASGTWHHVEFSSTHSFPDLRGADCELVEEFKDTALPKFTTRNVKSQLNCVPYQTAGNRFSLSFDVLVANNAPSPPSGGAH
jgi:hypothetical protein